MGISLGCALSRRWIRDSVGRGSRNRLGGSRIRHGYKVSNSEVLMHSVALPVNLSRDWTGFLLNTRTIKFRSS